jgi:NADH-quinone oxidoreductase subunit N
MMLYGISLIYGFTGSLDFATIAHVVKASGVSIGLTFGLVFLIAGLAFKISAVPFHMWTPDVYEGAPTPITAYLATASKVASLALVLRAIVVPFPSAFQQWQQIIICISVLSMALGAFAAIGQTNIKRLMAYSSIGHMGYALLGLAAGTQLGLRGVLFYLAFYSLTNIGVFACIQAMRRDGQAVEQISDLAGLARTRPMLAFAFASMMLSLSGLPPLAGIVAKAFIFLAAIQAHLYILAIFGVLTSVVGAYYYLRIVKVMYFDEAMAQPFDRNMGWSVATVAGIATVFTLVFVFRIDFLLDYAGTAAQSLLK